MGWCSEFSELIDNLKDLGFQGNMFVTTRSRALQTCEELLRLKLDVKMQIIIMYLSSQVARLRRFLDGEKVWEDYPVPQFPLDPSSYTQPWSWSGMYFFRVQYIHTPRSYRHRIFALLCSASTILKGKKLHLLCSTSLFAVALKREFDVSYKSNFSFGFVDAIWLVWIFKMTIQLSKRPVCNFSRATRSKSHRFKFVVRPLSKTWSYGDEVKI